MRFSTALVPLCTLSTLAMPVEQSQEPASLGNASDIGIAEAASFLSILPNWFSRSEKREVEAALKDKCKIKMDDGTMKFDGDCAEYIKFFQVNPGRADVEIESRDVEAALDDDSLDCKMKFKHDKFEFKGNCMQYILMLSQFGPATSAPSGDSAISEVQGGQLAKRGDPAVPLTREQYEYLKSTHPEFSDPIIEHAWPESGSEE